MVALDIFPTYLLQKRDLEENNTVKETSTELKVFYIQLASKKSTSYGYEQKDACDRDKHSEG